MSQKILIVEDEEKIARFVELELVHEGYEVVKAFDGRTGLDLALSEHADLIVLDVMLPRLNGLEVLRRIRKEGNNVPILLLTARDAVMDKVSGLDAGADDYITKPFAIEELLARIRAMTRTQTVQRNSQLKVGNITLDRATYELSAASGSYRLANKEFQMMEMLMANPGTLISAEQFMDKIWGYDTDVEMNVVWVYLSYLRKKLQALQAPVAIRAVRGLGYKLERV